MSKVTLEQLGLGADDLAAIGKLSEKGMTPEQIADAVEKVGQISSSASKIDGVVLNADNGIKSINFINESAYTKDTWSKNYGAIITGNSVKLTRTGTQSKITIPSTIVSGQKYILIANIENLISLNQTATIISLYNYSQGISNITISEYNKKVIAIPFIATINGSIIQVMVSPSAVNTLPLNTELVSFDSRFIGCIPWTQEDEDYWTMISDSWMYDNFTNLKATSALIADRALNVELPTNSFKEIKSVSSRNKLIFDTNITAYNFIDATETGTFNTIDGKFNCSGTRDSRIANTKLWFGFDIKPINYVDTNKIYVAVIDGVVECTNVSKLYYTQYGKTPTLLGQDFEDGVPTTIKSIIELPYSMGESSISRYTFLTQSPKVAGVLTYSCSFTTFSIFEKVEGFTIDDYIEADKKSKIIPLYSPSNIATKSYVDNTIDISVNGLGLSLNSNSFSPKYDIEMLLSGGQSLNVGGNAASNANDFKNTISFAGGSGLYGKAFTTTIDKDTFYGTDFTPIVKATETYPPITASITSILRLLELENRTDINKFGSAFMPFAWGSSGTSITTQYKGSQAYADMIEVVTKANEYTTRVGKTFAVRTMNWYHGEADSFQTKDWYYTRLAQMFTDINTDIKAITGQTEDIEFFTYQTAGWSNRNMGVQEAQLQLATERANVHLSGAMYQFSYADTFHPVDRAVIGLQTGVAIKRVVYDNLGWVDFKPVSHRVISNGGKYYIHLKFDVPVKPLRFDISGDIWHNPKGKQTNFGFEVIGGGAEKQIAEPFVTRGDTVVLTTTENPIGMTIKYAVTGHDGGGNLCDSQNIIIRNKNIDYVIDNFAVSFSNYIIT